MPQTAARHRPGANCAGPDVARIGRGAHLQPDGDGFVGGGPAYVVRFDCAGMEFTPAFGSAAPHDTPLRFRGVEARRGSTAVELGARVRPMADANGVRVEYARGGCVERYELREEGVEQSFVFDRLPAGSGDLVVRGRLDCELAATAEGGGLRFDLAGVGHFRIGEVVGVAADGARAQGTMRLDHGVLELSLPEAFVRDAALPLTLDPLVGNVLLLHSGNNDVADPRIAYDLTTDRYLVVWEHIVSATDSNIVGQLFTGVGSPVCPATFIEVSTAYAHEPAVANINAADAFVVAYTKNNNVVAVAASAGFLGFLNTLLTSAEVVIAGAPQPDQHPDVGGEATLLDDHALCVWRTDGASRTAPSTIQARQVSIQNGASFNPSLTLTSSPVIVLGGGHDHPRLSRSAGAAGRYALVTDFVASSNHDPYATMVNRLGQPISGSTPLSTSTLDETVPAVDGDGTTFVAAWMQQFTAVDHDVLARAFSYDPTGGSIVFNSSVASIANTRADDQGWPSVCWTGGSCLVGYMDQDTPGTANWSAYLKSVDLMHCTACEAYFWLGRNNGMNMTPQVACKTPGLLSPEDGMVVWESATTTTLKGDILGRQWSTQDGKVTQLVGSCGNGGVCYAACARLGNSSYAYELRAAAPSSPTVFLLSAAQLTLPCGQCLLVPNPAAGVAVGLSTSPTGGATVASAIPNDPRFLNVPLYVQWATVNAAAPACARFQVDLSNALTFTIEG